MNILVVDDHELFREGLALVLQGMSDGCVVYQAQTGNDALSILNNLLEDNIDLDIILLDFNLPDFSGIDLMKDIKVLDSSLPIAILSGENDIDLIKHAIDEGASGFITKNSSTEDMLNAIRSILNGGIFVPENALLNTGTPATHKDKMVDFKVKQRTEEMHQNMQNLLKSNLELKMMSSLDALTGIPNRRNIDEYIDQVWESAKNANRLISIAFIDADYFKKINDTYGHDAGDLCLAEIARTLSISCKSVAGRVGRYGGEEFIAVFDNKTQQQVFDSMNVFRKELESKEIEYHHKKIKMTVSIGIASALPQGDTQIRDVVRLADKSLYEAKNNGRNQVVNGGEI